MDKKPLIGVSICAVVLLVIASLTNVVGYQSVKSTIVNDSPLFTTRTRRATNQEQNILTFQYLGMGKYNLLQFPLRDNKTELLKRAVDIVSKMDGKSFTHFTELLLQQTREDKTLGDITPNEIVQTLQLLRTKPEAFMHSLNNNITPPTVWEYTLCNWFPGCIPFNILGWLLYFLFVIYLLLNLYWWTAVPYTFCGPACVTNQIKQYFLGG